MMHKVLIDEYDICDSLSMILLGETLSNPPMAKTSFQDVSGRLYGSVDLSSVYGTRALFERREGEITLFVRNSSKYQRTLNELAKIVHGKESIVWLSNDHEFYYKGRCYISSIKKHIAANIIVISVIAEPYKLKDSSVTSITNNSAFMLEGNATIYPVMTLANIASYTYVQLTHTNTGKYIKVSSPSGTFTSQNIAKLVIDFEEKHCEFIRTNGTVMSADPYVYLGSDYFGLEPNESSKITIYPSGATTTMKAVERWL